MVYGMLVVVGKASPRTSTHHPINFRLAHSQRDPLDKLLIFSRTGIQCGESREDPELPHCLQQLQAKCIFWETRVFLVSLSAFFSCT